MTASMTAFSRQQTEQDWGSLTWEIRSANHRYLETSVRLPESVRRLESAVRGAVRKKLSRGKVECQLRLQSNQTPGVETAINSTLLKSLIAANRSIQQQLGERSPIDSMELLRWPGVITGPQPDTEVVESVALALLHSALDELVASRLREGSVLTGFLRQRIQSIRRITNDLQQDMPDLLAAQRQSLLEKLRDLKLDLDPARLEQEVVLLVQKADIDEELDRLNAHLDEVERVLQTRTQQGRRLDFLMQELNREANTLASKAVVVATTRGAVEVKVLIEQMREQIQNIE